MSQKVLEIIARVLEVPRAAVTVESSPKTLQQWDSLKHMNLILATEEAFGVAFGDDDLVAIADARTLIDALRKKGAANV